jgi:hypothetical protein
MVGSFACPECGAEVVPAGLTPGRQVRCAACSTLVEVPFIPRASTARRRKSTWKPVIAGVSAASILLVIVVATKLAISAWRSKGRAERDREVALLVASSRDAERRGQIGRAYVELEAALRRAADSRDNPYPEFEQLRKRRDVLSRRDVEERLNALTSLPPATAVGEALTLAERAGQDPALADLTESIQAALNSARQQRAQTELQNLQRASDAGDAAKALAVCEQIFGLTTNLPSETSAPILDKAKATATQIAENSGIIAAPVTGTFLHGTADSFRRSLAAPLAEGLHARGYVLAPAFAPLNKIWLEHARFRLSIAISEAREAEYLQSGAPTSRIDATIRLDRVGNPVWQTTVAGRTRTPVPGLSALEARQVATQPQNPKAERRLYDDARAVFHYTFVIKLRMMPSPG